MFPEITHQYLLFAPLILHLKHFEPSSLLWVEKCVLDIGRNSSHSIALELKTSNFSYSLKKTVFCVKLLSKKFTPSQKEAPQVYLFLLQNSPCAYNVYASCFTMMS